MKIQKLGTEYGKHYVIPELLNENSIVYSFGIGEDISFDLQLMEKTNCSVKAFDPTPKSLSWIKSQTLPEKFSFYEYGLSDKDGILKFDPPPNVEWVSYKESESGSFEFPVKKLSTILNELNHTGVIDFVKMDIEGSEYSVLDNMIEEKLLPIQMSIEFHKDFATITDWITKNKSLRDYYHAYLFENQEIYFLLKSVNINL